MDRIYIEYDNAKITFGDGILLNVEMYDGRTFDNLEARRLFPITGIDKYITLLDEEGNEKAVIRDVNYLMDESRVCVKKALEEYYLVPKILYIIECYEKFGLMKMKVETDRGIYSFDIKSRYNDIKILYDGRVLLRDASDNRYEIEKFDKLDKRSKKLFNSYM
ncbi:MAG: hypothetical protein BWY46_00602 [Firmicutes bacterium ADurb.Bin300]|jgi:hypothetical protein|nr:MAG: hypothetical protein BWY46_00602 [Firmicutes bacterium ADurb.Bin300]